MWITATVLNECEYCVAAHSALVLKSGVDSDVVTALWFTDEEVDDFLAAGYTKRNVMDVILGVGMKTLSNYTNHVAHTPLDPAWQGQEWKRP
ncbi:hypothetical protein SD37_26195 [Amycolatopsis orientalis]|uniref:Carboxymuconolactone decarboxylase-like domain-containing protein n=1 Tax=Amycolatopsis orientalis TaxID=31958 RepID=A0A193C301_AMYOR|nr:hypothetical protein SD37_26195 [Amycolatopsis orientalis]